MKKYFIKYKKIFLLTIAILLLFCVQTIAYSAINATFNISGNAYARATADIRITNFKIAPSSTGSISFYEEFSKNTISGSVRLLVDAQSITYDVEVANYGNVDMGIFDITGLPNGMNYELINYNLQEKICDDTGKCNNMAKKTFQIKLTGAPGDYEFTLNFH